MLCIPDTIYSFYLQNKFDELKELYSNIPNDFLNDLNYHYH